MGPPDTCSPTGAEGILHQQGESTSEPLHGGGTSQMPTPGAKLTPAHPRPLVPDTSGVRALGEGSTINKHLN